MENTHSVSVIRHFSAIRLIVDADFCHLPEYP